MFADPLRGTTISVEHNNKNDNFLKLIKRVCCLTKNQLHSAFIMYQTGKPVSFLGFGQNVSKWVVNLRGKPGFSLLCIVTLRK